MTIQFKPATPRSLYIMEQELVAAVKDITMDAVFKPMAIDALIRKIDSDQIANLGFEFKDTDTSFVGKE